MHTRFGVWNSRPENVTNYISQKKDTCLGRGVRFYVEKRVKNSQPSWRAQLALDSGCDFDDDLRGE